MPASRDERLRNHFGIVRMDRIQGRLRGHQLPSITQVRASGSLTLTTTHTDVPGCSVTVAEDGEYEVDGLFHFVITTTGVGVCVGSLNVAGVLEDAYALYNTSGTGIATPGQKWIVEASAGDVIKLQAAKFSAAGAAEAGVTNTSLTVRRSG